MMNIEEYIKFEAPLENGDSDDRDVRHDKAYAKELRNAYICFHGMTKDQLKRELKREHMYLRTINNDTIHYRIGRLMILYLLIEGKLQ